MDGYYRQNTLYPLPDEQGLALRGQLKEVWRQTVSRDVRLLMTLKVTPFPSAARPSIHSIGHSGGSFAKINFKNILVSPDIQHYSLRIFDILLLLASCT